MRNTVRNTTQETLMSFPFPPSSAIDGKATTRSLSCCDFKQVFFRSDPQTLSTEKRSEKTHLGAKAEAEAKRAARTATCFIMVCL